MNETKPDWRDFTSLWDRPGSLIRRLHQIHVALFLEECSEFNITPVQFGVLTVLYGGETLDQVTIAHQLGADRNTVADVIKRLEQRGFLERPVSMMDRRTKLARITDEGHAFVDAVQPKMINAQRQFTEPLDPEEYDILMRLLRKLIRENNEASRAPMRPRTRRHDV